jgi:hypothetical protein
MKLPLGPFGLELRLGSEMTLSPRSAALLNLDQSSG